MSRIKDYYYLTKPGIVRGNLYTSAAALFLAFQGHVHFKIFVATLVGIALIIACACVINNYTDRKIDSKMARTKTRALVQGKISTQNSFIYAAILGVLGFLALVIYTNLKIVSLGVLALFFYVVLYAIAKRKTIYGTLVGSVSGALPPAAAYLAASNRISGAVILFVIMVFWQMPHFYSIAIYRLDDYKAAGLPVWPVKKGISATKIQILIYIIGFILVSQLLTIYNFTSYFYSIIIAITGIAWLVIAIKGYKSAVAKIWARKMFIFSLMVVTIMCLAISIDSFLY